MRQTSAWRMWVFLALTPAAFAEGVTVPGTPVSFLPPEGFTPLTEEELELKFPNAGRPRQAYGNEHRTTTVAYDVKPLPLTLDTLRQSLDSLGEIMGKGIPGVVLVDKKMLTLGVYEWGYLEFTSVAVDADIHNIVLMAPWQGKTIVFNFNATRDDFERLEPVLRESIRSIH